MRKFIIGIWFCALGALVLANLIWGSFPIGALLAVGVLYFRWKEALFWLLSLGLIWESTMPIPLGTAAIPMCIVGLSMQLLARHQLRSNNLTRGFCAIILQSVGQLSIGFMWPPRNFGNLSLQMTEAFFMLLMAALLAPPIILAVVMVGQRMGVSLEGRLRQL